MPVRQRAPEHTALTFNEPLSWKAGKPVPVATLVKRLKALADELASLEQESVNRQSMATVAKELVMPALLQHKDKGVRAYAACCLTDILRLHAPDAPYTVNQLRDIFELFIKQLKLLVDPDATYRQQYLYLLDSLSSVKSVVLLSDVPSNEPLILQLFTTFFDLGVSEIPINVEYLMTDILVQIVDEFQILPNEVIDVIVAQFLRANPSAALNVMKRKPDVGIGKGTSERERRAKDKDDKRGQQQILIPHAPPPAYNMAKSLCNTCQDKMSRHICQYFSKVIFDAMPTSREQYRTSMSPDGSEESHHEPSEEDIRELSKAHLLVKELWRAAPGVLSNVISQLEEELQQENLQLRLLAIETIGDMVVHGTFAIGCSSTWKAWQGRAADRSFVARTKWIEGAVRILRERSDQVGISLIPIIADRLNSDPDERVRLAACRAVGDLGYASIVSKLCAGEEGEKLLQFLSQRCKDRKHIVRQEAMKVMARIWDMAYPDIVAGHELIIKQLGWIPGKMMEARYVNEKDVNLLLDHVVFEILLPLDYPHPQSSSEKASKGTVNGKGKSQKDDNKENENSISEADRARAERLLTLVHHMEDKSKKAFLSMAQVQTSYGQVLPRFIKAAEDWNGGVAQDEGIDEKQAHVRLKKIIDWLASQLPEPDKASDALWKWVKAVDRRGWGLVNVCINTDASWISVVKSIKEIIKRIESGPSSHSILETIVPLLYRSSVLIFNKSHVPTIIDYSRSDKYGLGTTANMILTEISAQNPAIFKAHIASLASVVQEHAPAIPGSKSRLTNPNTGPVDQGIVNTLKTLVGFSKSFPHDLPKDRKFHQALFAYATSEKSNPTAAKHAVIVLISAALARKEMYAADLIQKCAKEWEYGKEGFLVQMGALTELVLRCREQCEELGKKMEFREVLFRVRNPETGEEAEKAPPDWVPNSQLGDEGWAKLLALKIQVNRLRALADIDSPQRVELAEWVFRLLNKLVVDGGELSKEQNTPRAHQSRLKLAAAQYFLKLAQTKAFDLYITPLAFNRISLIAQDHIRQVRKGFIDKLKKYLNRNLLPARYYTIIFLMAFEPNEDMKEDAVTWMKARARTISAAAAAASTQVSPNQVPLSGTHPLPSQIPNVIESLFARLLSLLSHHPNFPTATPNDTKLLVDFAKYILFYLRIVATEENISLIYHIAQKVKLMKDKIDESKSENLVHLSELGQVIVRKYADMHNWSLQSWPGRLRLPEGIFDRRPPEEANRIALKTFLKEDIEGAIEGLLRSKSGKVGVSKKRKSDASSIVGGRTPLQPAKKKARRSLGTNLKDKDKDEEEKTYRSKVPKAYPKTPKTPSRKKKKEEEVDLTTERRRSGRQIIKVKYIEDEDDSATGSELEQPDTLQDDGESEAEDSGEEENEKESADEMEVDDGDDEDDDGEDERERKKEVSRGISSTKKKKPPPRLKKGKGKKTEKNRSSKKQMGSEDEEERNGQITENDDEQSEIGDDDDEMTDRPSEVEQEESTLSSRSDNNNNNNNSNSKPSSSSNLVANPKITKKTLPTRAKPPARKNVNEKKIISRRGNNTTRRGGNRNVTKKKKDDDSSSELSELSEVELSGIED